MKEKGERRDVIKEVLAVLPNSSDGARAFATVVHKASFPGRHAMEMAFEDVCSRFDKFLRRVDSKGLIILDESAHATRLQELAHQFRKLGTQWKVIRNMIEAPLFVTSRAMRPARGPHRLRRLPALRGEGCHVLRRICQLFRQRSEGGARAKPSGKEHRRMHVRRVHESALTIMLWDGHMSSHGFDQVINLALTLQSEGDRGCSSPSRAFPV